MSERRDHTRREFLIRLAKASAFVPPALVTLRVSRAYGQGQGPGGGGQAAGAAQQTAGGVGQGAPVTGGPSPAGTARMQQGTPTLDPDAEPWEQQGPAGPPPWSRPPPTQGGRPD